MTEVEAAEATKLERTAIERSKALARAIGATSAFLEFEATQEALEADGTLRLRLQEFNLRDQERQKARAWGGADPEEERALEREWQELAAHPTLAAHLAARQGLVLVCGELANAISESVGLDFAAVCAPSKGCC